MFLLKSIIFLAALLLIFYLAETIVRKVAKAKKQIRFFYKPINKNQKIGLRFFYKPINKNQKIGQGVIFFLFFIFLIFHTFLPFSINLGIMLLIYMVVLNLYRAFMEWKYDKESKEHIVTFSVTVLLVIIMFIIIKLNVVDKFLL